jgi:acetyl esterase/lipase
MIEYRLSPEYPYPLPQQDMRQVYAALLDQYGAARLIVSGESAGGNQALSLMQHARDSGLALPRCAVLLSPWCDLANQGDSHIFNDARDPTLNNAWVDIAASWHAGDCALDDPGLSPIHGDMHGLPPCIITTGSRDLLLSQCLRLAAGLRAAGVECDLRVWDGLWHVFEFYPIAEAQLSIAEVAAFIRAH